MQRANRINSPDVTLPPNAGNIELNEFPLPSTSSPTQVSVTPRVAVSNTVKISSEVLPSIPPSPVSAVVDARNTGIYTKPVLVDVTEVKKHSIMPADTVA